MIQDMGKIEEAIHSQITDICYYMRGGITWNEAWSLSYSDREKLITSIGKKLKAASGDTTEYM